MPALSAAPSLLLTRKADEYKEFCLLEKIRNDKTYGMLYELLVKKISEKIELTLQSESSLDEIGWRLLATLQGDPRQSWSALGRAVGLSTPAVSERMRRMEESGLVAGYSVILDPARLGRPLRAFMRLNAEAGSHQRVIDLCHALPAVIECHHLSGDDGYLIRLAVTGVAELEDVIARFRLFGRAETSLILSSPIAGKPLAKAS